MQGLFQQRDASFTVFHRACAVLCLLLLCFSIGHTVFGHGGFTAPVQTTASHELAPLNTDTPDACALCVAMASAVVLLVFAVGVPRATQPRPPMVLIATGPITGWHPSLFCRPPPDV